jgi:hypothetical protein
MLNFSYDAPCVVISFPCFQQLRSAPVSFRVDDRVVSTADRSTRVSAWAPVVLGLGEREHTHTPGPPKPMCGVVVIGIWWLKSSGLGGQRKVTNAGGLVGGGHHHQTGNRSTQQLNECMVGFVWGRISRANDRCFQQHSC